MAEEKNFLSLLQITVPPDTALTVAAQVKILEILGIVSSPELVKSADIAVGMIPANTPASLHGMVILLNNLVKHHPKADKSHHDELATVMKDVNNLPDSQLDFGTFLSICESIIKAKDKEVKANAHKKSQAAKAKPAVKRKAAKTTKK